jgi:hypothetical protein
MHPERWINTVPLRLRSLFRRPQADQDLDDEIRDHLERRTEEYVSQGMSPEAARYAALKEFGGIERAKEECRDSRKVNWIFDFTQDAGGLKTGIAPGPFRAIGRSRCFWIWKAVGMVPGGDGRLP